MKLHHTCGFAVLMLFSISSYAQKKNELTLDVSQTNEASPVDNVACRKVILKKGYRFKTDGTTRMRAHVDPTLICDVDYCTNCGTNNPNTPTGIRDINPAFETGTSGGAFDASSTGAATYSIPLMVPPGTAGMQPGLSLVYNSQGTNGLLGMSWDLAGLSAVSRAGQSLYHEGVITAVSFSSDDRFMLDGNRLVNTTAYAYGSNNAVYGKESEDFSVIKQFGNAGGGPLYFTVTAKDGTVMEYGNAADARVMADGSGSPNTAAVMKWLLNKVKDARGNYMEIHYHIEAGKGECWPERINYTGNIDAGLSTYNEVRFSYAKKSDQSIMYVAGMAVSETVLLTEVAMYAEGKKARSYTMNYGYNLYSHLETVTETNSKGEQYNPVVVEWEQQRAATDNNIVVTNASPVEAGDGIICGDFNGDGILDLLSDYQNGTASWKYNPGKNSNGLLKYETTTTAALKGFAYKELQNSTLRGRPGMVNTDLNGDGYEDLIIFKSTDNLQYQPAYGNADGTFDITSGANTIPRIPQEASHIQVGDFTGDGLSDLLIHNNDNGYGYKLYSFIDKVTSQAGGLPNVIFPASDFYTINFNGNGKTDLLLWTSDNRWIVYEYDPLPGTLMPIYQANASVVPVKQATTTSGYYQRNADNTQTHYVEKRTFKRGSEYATTGDFNGDGRSDILVFDKNLGKWVILYGTGKGFVIGDAPITDLDWTSDKTLPSQGAIARIEFPAEYYVTDLNGDGKSDIMEKRVETLNSSTIGHYTFYYSNGTGFTKETVVAAQKGFGSQKYASAATHQDHNESDGSRLLEADITIEGTLPGYFLSFSDVDLDGYPDVMIDVDQSLQYILLKQGRQTVKSVVNGQNYQTRFTFGISDFVNGSKNAADYGIQQQFMPPLKVLKRVDFADLYTLNPVLTNAITYNYSGPLQHFTGKGFLGFLKYTEKNLSLNTLMTREYEFVNATEMLLLKGKKIAYNSGKESTVSYTNTTNTFGDKRYFSFANTIVNQDALTSTTVTESAAYNAKGTPTYQKTVYGADYTVETTTNYADIEACATCPSKITTTSTRTGKTPYSRYVTLPEYSKRLLTKQVDDKGLVSTYTYSSCGNMLTQTLDGSLPDKRVTEMMYDPYQRYVVQTTQPCNGLKHITTMEREPIFGNVLSQKDINGLLSSFTYDGMGRLTGSTTPTGQKTTITYTWNNGLAVPNQSATRMHTESTSLPAVDVYADLFGRTVKTSTKDFNDKNITSEQVYNNNGQLSTATEMHYADGEKNTTTYAYTSDDNRLKTVLLPTQATLSYTYSTTNNGVTVSNSASGQSAGKTYDAAGMLKTTSENGIDKIAYTYHSCGKPEKITTVSTSMLMQYDAFGYQQFVTDANAGTSSYLYNAFGEMTSQTDANGKTTSMTYDALGRVLTTNRPEGLTSYLYDTRPMGMGMPATISGFNVTQDYFYDDKARVKQQKEAINGKTFTAEFIYDALNRPLQRTYPGGFKVNYTYKNGQLEKVLDAQDNTVIWKCAGTNQRGQILAADYGNGLSVANTYDQWGFLLTNSIAKTANNSSVRDYTYEFDVYTGNLKKRSTGTALTEEFLYDDLNRLTAAIHNRITQGVSYKDNGNIDSKSDVGGQYLYQNKHPHAVDQVTDAAAVFADNETQDILYNSFNKATAITETFRAPDAVNKLQLAYGPDLQRRLATYTSTSNGVQTGGYTRYYSNGQERTETLGSTAVRQLDYIAAGEGLCAIHVKSTTGPDSLYYVYGDHLGSIHLITDKTGAIKDERSYDAWGRLRNPASWSPLPAGGVGGGLGLKITDRGYTTHEHLEAFGLINMNGRMYDPLVGRMLSCDPVIQDPDASQSYNRYAYCMNNPLKYTDPTGYVGVIGHYKSQQAAGDAQMNLEGFNILVKQDQFHSGAGVGPQEPVNVVSEAEERANEFVQDAIAQIKSGGINTGGGAHQAFDSEEHGSSVSERDAVAVGDGDGKGSNNSGGGTWDAVTNQRIGGLDSRIQGRATDFINAVQSKLGITLRVSTGFRSVEQQNIDYAQGRTTPGSIITWARGGESPHNYGLAIDVVGISNGQINWSIDWDAISKIGKSFGLEWGGDWARPKTDRPHFQMPNWRNLIR